ncbi:TonB-dependent receptor [Phaeocystidibacter luteus]|uniref:TonB-dependent receptor n=1 Tax=Phaeocystidibacter luteus TaxID=911197 RepID=A0A6N6RDW5_9FLAO|nr:TonB-dependent receptor [Phaeocystidibacter luteus]KAB2805366.1 TonB-dependent receptor [Phaeocystidibacter luteus]
MKYLYSSLFLLFSVVTLAQTGNIRGYIYDEQNLPLPGVSVEISEIGKMAVTDLQGQYVLTGVPVGSQTITIHYIGYTDQSVSINVEEGKTVSQTTVLTVSSNELGEVIVTGNIIRGQAKALNTQRTNGNITNVVSSDQVGRFPDANIGEAMRRIPGITMQNDQGEARDIIIRGMAPQLNSVMINGERVPSAEGDNRRIQMDLIPADMIQTIEVNKAVTPNMDADAIGGSVNLVTRAAPNGQRISVTGASGITAFNNQPLYTGAFVYGNRVANDRLGIVVSGSYNDVDYGSDNVEFEWDYDANEQDRFITDQQIRQYYVRRARRSISTNLDYRLAEGHTVYVRGIYNWRDDWENRYRYRLKDIEKPDANGISLAEVERQSKGGIDSDRIKNARLEDQRMWNVQVGGDHLFGNLEMNWMVTRARASEERSNERYIEYAFDDGNTELISVRSDFSDPRFPLISAVNPGATQGSNMVLNELTEEYQFTEENDLNARLDFTLPLSDGDYASELQFGGRYRNKEKLRANDFYEYEPNDGSIGTMDDIDLINVTNEDFLAGSKYQAGRFASPEALGRLNLNGSNFDSELLFEEFAPANYTATENITAAYAMIDQKIGAKLRVIAGLRWENTQTTYTGNRYNDDTDEVEGTTGDQNYNNFLPGIHLKYDVQPNLILRAAWTNTLARPNYYDIAPYELIIVDDNEIELGNPNLTPALATNFDLMGEYYYKSIGILSAGVFYKQIDDFIYTSQRRDVAYNGNVYDVFTQPLNGGTADVFGVELAWQRKLDFIPGKFWNAMSIYTNYTYTETSTTGVDGREEGLPLPGTANHMLNGSLAYNDETFTVRVSVNYADDYIDEYGDEAFFDRYYDEQLFLDVNVSYAITPYLRIFAEATNLTNQPLRYYQGIQEQTMQMEYYNARYQFGVKLDL